MLFHVSASIHRLTNLHGNGLLGDGILLDGIIYQTGVSFVDGKDTRHVVLLYSNLRTVQNNARDTLVFE